MNVTRNLPGLLLRSGLKDLGRIFIVALVLDTAYQLFVLRNVETGTQLVLGLRGARR